MFIHDTIVIEYIRQGYLPDYPYHLISEEEMFAAFIVDELYVDEQTATKVKQGNKTLWEDPRPYVTTYRLISFEFAEVDDELMLVLRGSRADLAYFNESSGLNCTPHLSSNCYFSANYPCEYDELKEAYNTLVDCIYYHISMYLASRDDASTTHDIPNWVYAYMNGSVIGPASSDADIHDMLVMLNMDNINDEITADIMKACYSISKKWIDKLPPSKNEMRPPTIFGEPHVIKSLRIAGLLADESF